MKAILSAANRQALKEGQQMDLDLPKEKDKDATMSLIPADFLIDERGVVQQAHYGKDMNDHIDLQDIRDFVFNPTRVPAYRAGPLIIKPGLKSVFCAHQE